MEIETAMHEYQIALIEREKISKQKDIIARKEVANRKRLYDAKDAVWAIEMGLTTTINEKLWNSTSSTQLPTPSETVNAI